MNCETKEREREREKSCQSEIAAYGVPRRNEKVVGVGCETGSRNGVSKFLLQLQFQPISLHFLFALEIEAAIGANSNRMNTFEANSNRMFGQQSLDRGLVALPEPLRLFNFGGGGDKEANKYGDGDDGHRETQGREENLGSTYSFA